MYRSNKGASNLKELHTLLYATIMIRRLKADIMKQLPPKTRYLGNVEIEDQTKAQEFGYERVSTVYLLSCNTEI